MNDGAPIATGIVSTKAKQMMLSDKQEEIVRSRLGNAHCMVCNDVLSYSWTYNRKQKRTLVALCYRCNISYYIRMSKLIIGMPREGAIKLFIKMRIAPLGTARNKVVEILGSKCAMCSVIDIELLELHHIHNDGANDRKRFGGAKQMWRYYAMHPEEARMNMQLLCANHHKLKTRSYRRDNKIAK